jgi:capsular polysaccharide biosynthesis protein
MDLRLFLGVLKRFRFVVIGGVIFAFLLAFMSIARVSFAGGTPHLIYRQPEIFAAQETLQITRQGQVQPNSNEVQQLAVLSDYYMRLANSDAVRRLFPEAVRKQRGLVVAAVVVSTVYGNAAPTNNLTITGEGPTPGLAIDRARAESAAFRAYVQQTQTAGNTPEDRRIVLQVLNRAAQGNVTVVQPRKKTVALMVFVAIIALTIGLALLLENLRPRLRLVDDTTTLTMDDLRSLQHQPMAGAGHADARR